MLIVTKQGVFKYRYDIQPEKGCLFSVVKTNNKHHTHVVTSKPCRLEQAVSLMLIVKSRWNKPNMKNRGFECIEQQ